jgi:hypothetical protein
VKEIELRTKWETQLDTTKPEWLDYLWNGPLRRDIPHAMLDPEYGLKDLVDLANEHLQSLRYGSENLQSKRPGRSVLREFAPSLSPEEIERAAAFEEYLTYTANFDRDLHRFRERVLGGQLLATKQACAFLRSPAAQIIPDSEFQSGGGDIPVISHHATLDHDERKRVHGKIWQRTTVSVNPPGTTVTVEEELNAQALPFVDEEGTTQALLVRTRSPLGMLRSLSEKLAERYRWEPAQSTMFVLTGKIPSRPPIRASYERKNAGWGSRALETAQGVIILEVAPWVSAKTVHRAFRAAQSRILGRDNRPIKEKNLKLFRFVTERLEPTGLFQDSEPQFPPGEEGMIEDELIAHGAYEKRPTGSELVREWDAQPWVQANQWTYRGNARQFLRDYRLTRARIAYSAPRLR